MKIVENHKSSFSIVSVKKETEAAAGVLASYLEKSTGCRLEIKNYSDSVLQRGSVILLDVMPFASPLAEAESLGDEGFVICERNGNVLIYAATEESIYYAVYEFLETYCGCLWLTSNDDYIPEMNTVEIEDGTTNRQIPLIQYREVYYRDAWDPEYARKQKINGQNSRVVNGAVAEGHKNWGFWCHSFFGIIPPSEYFSSHPEYFSLVDGKRINNGQLCCTNDEMIDEAIKNLRIIFEKNPDVRYWSVSQNDTTGFCTCEKCRKYDEEAGSHIGSILYFVNKVAEAFPDKIISTLSYWYSRTAPKKAFLRDNVHIMLCDIECDRSEPIAENPQCSSFMEDLAVWHKYCGNVFLWDYDIQFSNLISPFPNFHILAPNMRFFYEKSVRSIFNQANRENRGDFWALRAYLLAKLSWNPYCDIDKHYHEFLKAYYGAGAGDIDEYITSMTEELKKSGEGLSIFGQPEEEKFLSKELVKKYAAIVDSAIEKVKEDPVILLRVEEVKLGLIYVMLKAGQYDSVEERDNLICAFRRISKEIGLEKVEEWQATVDSFCDKVMTE